MKLQKIKLMSTHGDDHSLNKTKHLNETKRLNETNRIRLAKYYA